MDGIDELHPVDASAILGTERRSNEPRSSTPKRVNVVETSEQGHRGSSFTIFSQLPPEIRSQIWASALTPRIVKWIRVNNQNVFNVPSKSFPIFDACRESREAAILYGEYRNVSDPTSSVPVYFSPLIDYLFFDPGWTDMRAQPDLAGSPTDPLETLPDLSMVRNIMVHPNYADDQKRPAAFFENLPKLERILVAADEKSIGFQSRYMLGTIHDIDKYYRYTAKKRKPDVKIPYIAVGCLGWTGNERHSMHHGDEDNRQLVAMFENDGQMKAHLNMLREEEWNFTQERFSQRRPSLTLNFRPDAKKVDTNRVLAGSGWDVQLARSMKVNTKDRRQELTSQLPGAPPVYSEYVSTIPERIPAQQESESSGSKQDMEGKAPAYSENATGMATAAPAEQGPASRGSKQETGGK